MYQLPKSTSKVLKYLLNNIENSSYISNTEELMSKFPNYDNELAILAKHDLISVEYADDAPYFINVLPLGLTYFDDLKLNHRSNLKNSFVFPLITGLVGAIAGSIITYLLTRP